MNTEPPTGDDLQRMLVTMKQSVLDRAEDRKPAPRRRGRRTGIAIGVIALLGLGATGGGVALGMIPQPFAAAPAPTTTPSPTEPAAPSTPAAAPVQETPDPLPTQTPSPTPTKGAFALDDPSTWTISGSEVGPVAIGGELTAETDDLAAAYRLLPKLPGCVVTDTWARDGAGTVQLGWHSGTSGRTVSLVVLAAEGGATPTEPLPGPTTAAGIGLGSTFDELRAAYPTMVSVMPEISGPGSIWEVSLPDGVLRFQLGTDGEHVNAVFVTTDPNEPIGLCDQ
jgi:hypothetical protein